MMLSESDFKFDDLEIAVVENDPANLRGLVYLLEQLGCRVTWTARDDEEALAMARSNLPEVVFVDLRLLKGSDEYDPGWQLIKSLRQQGVGRPFTIIIYSGTPIVDQIVLEAVRLGCSYVVKEDLWGHEQEIVLGALLAARSGSVFLSNEVAISLETIVSQIKDRDILSPKEREVARLIADGLSNQEIATRLILGVTTIKTYVSRILGKLNVDNRGKVAEWYRQHYG